jgi:hypothetical protein
MMRRPARSLMAGSLLSGLLLGAAASLPAGAQAQTLTAEQIIARLNQHDRERQMALQHYGSQRTYHIDYHGPMGDRSAVVQARMDFSAPDQKHFAVVSETGSQMFCHKVLRKLMESEQEGALEANHLRTMLSSQNDHLKLIGEDELDGIKTWVLEVSPKVDSKFNYKGKVWVSRDDYAVVRIVGSPAKSPSWFTSGSTFDYRYARTGNFWLPQRNVTVSHVRMGGAVTLTVDYGAYEIVSGPVRSVAAETHEAPPRPAGLSKSFVSQQ